SRARSANAGTVRGRAKARDVSGHGRADDSDDESTPVYARRRVLHRRKCVQLLAQLRPELGAGTGSRGQLGPDEYEPNDLRIPPDAQCVLCSPAWLRHQGCAGSHHRLSIDRLLREDERQGLGREVHPRLREGERERDLVLLLMRRGDLTCRPQPDRPVFRAHRLPGFLRRRHRGHYVRTDPPAIHLGGPEGYLDECVADWIRPHDGPARRDDVRDGYPAPAHLGPQPRLAWEGSPKSSGVLGHAVRRVLAVVWRD